MDARETTETRCWLVGETMFQVVRTSTAARAKAHLADRRGTLCGANTGLVWPSVSYDDLCGHCLRIAGERGEAAA